MSEDFSEIRPKSVPLSHSAPAQPTAVSGPTAAKRLVVGLIAALLSAIGIVVFWVVPDLVQPPTLPAKDGSQAISTDASDSSPAPATDSELPPFQALQKQQARQRAQDELARFVELQIQLDEQMQVGEWGDAEYDSAKSLATAGDEHFVKEEFDAAIATYADATVALGSLIETGEGLFAQAMAAGLRALNERNPLAASLQFERALTIDPSDADALDGRRRADLLPQVNTAMRQAKNHELAGEYAQALEVYGNVNNLDPETFGLDAALAVARQGSRREQIKEHLSVGFSALDRGRLSAAKAAFNRALQLDSGNPVALGGLEQTDEKIAGNRIEELRETALAAERAEDWTTALERYAAVLASDANIQFAREGRQRATDQRRAAMALASIIASPEKLSSPQLYAQAEELLAAASALSPRGQRLDNQIDAVDSLINAYRDPVAVTFLSDNITQITVSTIGKLGSFDEKRLNLRPGAYTVIGSRDGCRDVREQIVVRPNMKPIEIRCLERL
jgi:tetratricopeptide (TPR) repeat protein